MGSVSRRTAIIIAVVAGLIVIAAGSAFAASFLLSAEKLGIGATETNACDTNGITAGIPSPLSWSTGSGPGQNLIQYNLTNVDNSCNGKKWQAVMGTATSLQCVASGSGTLSVSGNAATIMLSSDGCTIPVSGDASGGVGSLTVTFYE